MPAGESPRPWTLVRSDRGPEIPLFEVRLDLMRNPRTQQALQRLVLESRDWCNIVCLTPERRLVVVRQYRFGVEAVTTEIPGGIVDDGETSESTARRELLEETGFTAPRWTYLGRVEPNPAFQNNHCHHWLAEDAVQTHAPQPDAGEDIVVDTLTLDEVLTAIRSGGIQHSLVLSALAKVLDLRVQSI